jgi:hypothetical protein
VSYGNNRDVVDGSFTLWYCQAQLGKKVHKETPLRKAVVVTSLLNGCETWTLRVNRIKTSEGEEKRFLRWVMSYTILYRRRGAASVKQLNSIQ